MHPAVIIISPIQVTMHDNALRNLPRWDNPKNNNSYDNFQNWNTFEILWPIELLRSIPGVAQTSPSVSIVTVISSKIQTINTTKDSLEA